MTKKAEIEYLRQRLKFEAVRQRLSKPETND